MRLAVLAVLALVAVAAAAGSPDFHLWLKCKAIELYVNITMANYTLPQCREVLKLNYTYPGGALPMVGVGELKKLNITDPRRVFIELREVRLAAIRNLTGHVERIVAREFRRLNGSRGLGEAIDNTERGINTLIEVGQLLKKVNASEQAVNAVRERVRLLNRTRDMLRLDVTVGHWVGRLEKDVNKTFMEVVNALGQIRQLLGPLQNIKPLYDMAKQKAKTLNDTIEVLTNKTIEKVYREVDTPNVETAVRNIERGIKTLKNVEQLLSRVNASDRAISAVRKNVEWLNFTREILTLDGTDWLGEIRNVTDLEKIAARIERTMAHIGQLLDHLEKTKMSQLRQLVATKYKTLNATRELLIAATRDPQLWKEIKNAKGDVNKIREIIRQWKESKGGERGGGNGGRGKGGGGDGKGSGGVGGGNEGGRGSGGRGG